MNSKSSLEIPDHGLLGVVRAASLIATAVGAIGSEVLMVRAGTGAPRVVMALFVVWILLPFVALGWANLASTSWAKLIRVTLYCVTFAITLGSLAFFVGVILPPAGSPRAYVFVIVPAASWLLMVTAVPVAAWISRRRMRTT